MFTGSLDSFNQNCPMDLLGLEPKKDFKQIRCVLLQNSGLLQYSNTTYLVFTEKKTRLISWYFFGESTRRTRVEPGYSFFGNPER